MALNDKRLYTILSHVATWSVLFLLPMTFGPHNFPTILLPTAPVVAIFYLNYTWMASLYMDGHKASVWMIDMFLVFAFAFTMHHWVGTNNGYVFNLAVTVIIAISTRIAKHWQESEAARLKAEQAQVTAELSNLRYQTNPHFLLNTLNNIYALTAFDSHRAQEAIQELSAMLRHMLYDNLEQFVSIESEINFLQNYVKLMKLRLPDSVDVKFDISLDKSEVTIAPLLLIPLVENAFKHGVSMNKPSFVHIRLVADSHHIDFLIENTNYQKSKDDHSGHGIGLTQVQRRLELAYPGHYTWHYGPADASNIYQSHITITPLNTERP